MLVLDFERVPEPGDLIQSLMDVDPRPRLLVTRPVVHNTVTVRRYHFYLAPYRWWLILKRIWMEC